MHERGPDEIGDADWQSPARRAAPVPELGAGAQPLVLVAETVAVLAPMVAGLGGFLRVRTEPVAPDALAAALRERGAVGVLCHAPCTDASVMAVLRAVVAADPALPVMVVTEHDPSREARLAVAAEIIRLEQLVWLEKLPSLRQMVDFLFLAERRAGRAGLMPV